jgi:serine/threonine protein kinase
MAAQVPSRKYRIERYLAEGGMGAIYVGKKIGPGGFEKEVVLKQLLPEFTSRAEFRDLFFREAKITATLDHQNIVRTFDLVNANERLFIVMEYVRGADLRTIAWRARRRKPLSTQAIVHIALEILAGLAYAHSRRSPTGEPLGIIHRDLSPSNILCSGEGEVKLSDFGIAKAVTYSSVFYRVRGKVGYMSPEMARNQPIDARSDLFSLGVSIYETFIGERIYTGDLNTPPDKIYAQAVPTLASKCPGLPAELQGVLDRALAIDVQKRYPDAEAFAHALRQVAIAHSLLYSAPELAAELREIMGPDPEHWLTDKRDPLHARSARGGQAAGGAGADPANALVEPGASITAGDDSDVENVATPPARPSGSLPAVAGRPAGQIATEPSRPPEPPPATASPPSSRAPLPSAGAAEAMAATPPPPPAPQPPAARSPFAFPHLHLHRRIGGVAAFKRSHRKLWIATLLVLAVLLGFAFVRLFLRPAEPGSSRDERPPATSPAGPDGHRASRVIAELTLARSIHEDRSSDGRMQTDRLTFMEERRARHCRWKPWEGFQTFPRRCAAGKAGRLRTRWPGPFRCPDEMRLMNRTG